MIFAKVFTLTLAFYLASTAEAASFQRRQNTGEATQCLASIRQEVQSLSDERDQLIKSSKGVEQATIAIRSFLEGKYTPSLESTTQLCCPSEATGEEKFSGEDDQTLSSSFSELSKLFQATLSQIDVYYQKINDVDQKSAIKKGLESLEVASDRFAFCTIAKSTKFAVDMSEQQGSTSETLKRIIDA